MNNRSASLAHFSRGRIRLRADGLKGRREHLSVLREKFQRLPAIRRVDVNQRTGSVLLIYTPAAMENGNAVAALLESLTAVFSPVRAGPINIWRAGNNQMSLAVDAKTSAMLHAKICGALHSFRGISNIETDASMRKISLYYDEAVLAQHVQSLHNNMSKKNWKTLLNLFV